VRQVVVVGAGLAGCAVAAALAARGLAVQVIDRQAGPAQETSGNAGGLFHGVVHAHDGLHARWLRAAALHAARVLRPMLAGGQVPGQVPGQAAGLFRGERTLTRQGMQQLIDTLALPADFLRVADWPGTETGAAWLYPDGGWASPAALCTAWLDTPGITARFGQAVDTLRRVGDRWQLLGAPQNDGAPPVLAEADAVVLCNAANTQRLAGAIGDPWTLGLIRGQTTLLPASTPGLPALPQPLADGGYVLRLADGRWLCGATSQRDDTDPALRLADHHDNLDKLRRLTGWTGTIDPALLDGRVGWRLQTDDRLPLLGPLPDLAAAATGRAIDQPRHMPRQPGLWVFTALGSRGLTQAPLGAEVLAGWLTGEPVPLPAALLDALDPARFATRAVRRAARASVE
jgi:tRNA 5-methylaminomethyl-2-thiouridine biosynthesis bifunctional protein